MSRPGNVGEPVDVTVTSRVAEFNDLECLERQLAHGDVAAVLVEPALTNIGIVLPEPGYLEGVRELARRSPHGGRRHSPQRFRGRDRGASGRLTTILLGHGPAGGDHNGVQVSRTCHIGG